VPIFCGLIEIHATVWRDFASLPLLLFAGNVMLAQKLYGYQAMTLAEILESFPSELQPSVARLIEALREEFGVRRTDFDELKAVVRDLAEAQKDLAQAQKRTEQRVEELAEAQKRTELRLAELAEVQQRTAEGLVHLQVLILG
jgi:NADH dehydrogenase/NADH:ubiquinone oxidoreductase subunit G